MKKNTFLTVTLNFLSYIGVLLFVLITFGLSNFSAFLKFG